MGQKTSDIDLSVLFRREEWMKKEKSQVIGIYLAERYMDDATKACRKAFFFGCRAGL